MELKDALQLAEKQFDNGEYGQRQSNGPAANDDPSRYPVIIKLLKKIKRYRKLPKDFSLVDLGCGMAGVLKEIKKEFPHSDLYGVDAFPLERNFPYRNGTGDYEFYNLDFMELLELDFQCDVALMLNLYHYPGAFRVAGDNDINSDKLKVFMENLEKGISSNFDYFITLLNYKQYESFKNGFSYYSKIPIKIIYNEPIEVGDCSVNQWVVVEFEDNTK